LIQKPGLSHNLPKIPRDSAQNQVDLTTNINPNSENLFFQDFVQRITLKFTEKNFLSCKL
jgi:hypothetical protein